MSKCIMYKNLPPLNSLLAFEAAARLNSFKLAAQELHITPAAIAYQIKKLEQTIKVELFARHHKGVELNRAGQVYFTSIKKLLDDLQQHTQNIHTLNKRHSITILTLHAIAQKWLMPRLSNFRKNHPQVNVEINATDNLSAKSNSDIVIGFSLQKPDDPDAVVFMEEQIFPVCAKSYLEKLSHAKDKQHDYDVLLDSHWHQDWSSWIIKHPPIKQMNYSQPLRFSLYSMVIEAAVSGMGIMMGHKQLIKKELEDGSLIRLFEDLSPLRGFYYLKSNQVNTTNDVLNHFTAWINTQHQS